MCFRPTFEGGTLVDNKKFRTRLACGLLALVLAACLARPTLAQNTLGSRVNGLVSFDISDHYITPRGLNVEDKGVVLQPLTLLFWKLKGNGQGALTDVTLTTGMWNSFHSHASGAEPTRWNELDPILGLTFTFKNRMKVDVFTTSFYTPTDSYPTSTHLDLKLSYNDKWSEHFSVNPYFQHWTELNNKATVVFDPATSEEGTYVAIGATPTFNIGKAKIEIDTVANFASSDFYQKFDGSEGGSGFALFSTYPKVSVPLKFMGANYGAWTAYAGVAYFHLHNEGLLDGNQVLANPERQRNLARVRAGVSIFF